jgi:uncharacterized protein (DUF305 family)
VYSVITVFRVWLPSVRVVYAALLAAWAATLPPALAAQASAEQTPAPIVQPGAPGEAGRRITATQASDLSKVAHTEADAQFMRGMMMHHAQALEMTALRPTRSRADDLRLLALRIEISQADEIKMMKDWLAARGLPAADPHAHHAGHSLMPGMLTPAEMTRLADASGVEFERLFLELMIKHHDGALVMVRELFASADAAQESEVFAFASEVEADQAAEIGRMMAMLRERQR